MARRLVEKGGGDDGARKEAQKRRTPKVRVPVDPVNEQVLIAAALLDRDVRRRLAKRFRPESFLVEGHDKLWHAVEEMVRLDLEFSRETVGQLTGGEVDPDYVDRITSGTVPPNLRHHEELLSWDHARAGVAKGPLPELLQAFQDPTTPPERVRHLSEQVTHLLKTGGGHRHLISDPGRVASEVREDVERRHDGTGPSRRPFGIEGFDDFEDGSPRVSVGTMSGKTTVVTAVSGGGKSTMIGNVVLGQVEQGLRVAYGAWEMDDVPTDEMLACISLGLDRGALLAGRLDREVLHRIYDEVERLHEFVTFFRQPVVKRGEKNGNDKVISDIEGIVTDLAADVAVFDVWDRAFRFRSEDEQKESLDAMQQVSKRTGCHLIIAAQQRLKELEREKDKRPKREHIKGSSAFVDVADTIVGCHNPALWKAVPEDKLQLLILKQRYGRWPLAVDADFHPSSGRIWNCRSVEYRHVVDGGDSDLDAFLGGNK